ncbi:MAG: hypothetical protein V1847_04295 [Candidatus Diapherotrites archaeon]
MFGKVKQAVQSLASKVLDLDSSKLPLEQYKLLREYSQNHKFDLEVEELRNLVKVLKSKHAIESVLVANGAGTLLVSSNGTDFKDAIASTALLNYVQSEIPHSKTVLVKAKTWHMLFPHNGKVYVVKAASNLEESELQAIAEDLEGFFKRAKNAEYV